MSCRKLAKAIAQNNKLFFELMSTVQQLKPRIYKLECMVHLRSIVHESMGSEDISEKDRLLGPRVEVIAVLILHDANLMDPAALDDFNSNHKGPILDFTKLKCVEDIDKELKKANLVGELAERYRKIGLKLFELQLQVNKYSK